MSVLRRIAAALIAVLLGCAAPTSTPPQPAPPQPQVDATPVPNPPLRWVVREDCPLRYQVLTTFGKTKGPIETELPEPAPGFMLMRDVLVARGAADKVRFRIENTFTAGLRSDVRTTWVVSEWSNLPFDVRLYGGRFESDTYAWTGQEQDIRSPELALLWPPLPAQRSVGATRAWSLPVAEGEPEKNGTIALSERIEGGWRLTGTWRGDLYASGGANANPLGLLAIPPPEITEEGRVEATARWEISDDGRLLRADVVRDHYSQETVEGNPQDPERTRIHTEASLVKSCDGLAVPAPERAESVESRAVDTWTAVVRGTRNRAPVHHHFASQLVERHGADIDAALQRHLKMHGPDALGRPVWLPSITRKGTRLTLDGLGAGREVTPTLSYTIDAEFVLDTSTDPPLIVEVHVLDRSRKTPVILHIDETKIQTRPSSAR